MPELLEEVQTERNFEAMESTGMDEKRTEFDTSSDEDDEEEMQVDMERDGTENCVPQVATAATSLVGRTIRFGRSVRINSRNLS